MLRITESLVKRFPFLAITMLVLALPAFAQKEVDRPLITVTGQAEMMVVPDEVAFSLSVVSREKELPAAQEKNDQIVKTLLALARQYQVPANKMQTGYISVSQRFTDEDVTKKPPVFLGYTVTKNVGIILQDVSKAEALLADIFKSGVSSINGVSFRTSKLRQYKDQARAMAIKAAQEKASALTKEIGQSIGKAYTITEEAPNTYAYSQNRSNSNFSMSAGDSADSGEGTLALGQISITAQVTVSFELK